MPRRIAVVTPTFGRPRFIEQALRYFRYQEVPGAELRWFVLDDSPEPHALFAIPADDVSYVWQPQRLALGAKRNRLNDLALDWGADFITALDDDDWYGPTYVQEMTGMLAVSDDALFAGSSTQYLYHVATGNVVRAETARAGSSGNGVLSYRAAALEVARYPDDLPVGEDRAFLGDYAVLQHSDVSRVHLALAHGRNTESKDDWLSGEAGGPRMTLDDFPMREEDKAFYRGLTTPTVE